MSLKENDTYKLTNLPQGRKIVGGRWIYALKENVIKGKIFKAAHCYMIQSNRRHRLPWDACSYNKSYFGTSINPHSHSEWRLCPSDGHENNIFTCTDRRNHILRPTWGFWRDMRDRGKASMQVKKISIWPKTIWKELVQTFKWSSARKQLWEKSGWSLCIQEANWKWNSDSHHLSRWLNHCSKYWG